MPAGFPQFSTYISFHLSRLSNFPFALLYASFFFVGFHPTKKILSRCVFLPSLPWQQLYTLSGTCMSHPVFWGLLAVAVAAGVVREMLFCFVEQTFRNSGLMGWLSSRFYICIYRHRNFR